MTTPEPLTYQEIDQAELALSMLCRNNTALRFDRLIHTARIGAKFLEATEKGASHDTES